MTRKEAAKMRRLEIRIEELEKALNKAIQSQGEEFMNSFNIQYAMRCAIEEIREGLNIMEKASLVK